MSYDTENLNYAIAKLAEKIPEHSDAMRLLEQVKRHLLVGETPSASRRTPCGTNNDTALLDWLRDNRGNLHCRQADGDEAAGWTVQLAAEQSAVRHVFRDPREAIRAAMARQARSR